MMASLLFPALLRVSCTSTFPFPPPVTDEKHNFSGQTKDNAIWVPRLSPSAPYRLKVRAEKFNLWQLLGGRGLAKGEEGLREELKRQIPSGGQSPSLAGQEQNGEKMESNNPAGTISTNWIGDDKTFEKELLGMTGGFPGGEKGLIKFLRDNPPPAKDGAAAEISSELGKLSKPRAAPQPPLQPGMIVIVKNPENPYHMLNGTVQKVADGNVAVLFEGGNLSKLVTFKLEDLERSKGPDTPNPKSAILETMDMP